MKRRILAIDGGGIRGILPAHFLAQLGPIAWDMAAGTSVGGIIACGIAHGISAMAIETMLVTKGPDIFGNARINLLQPKFNAAPLEAELLAQFGETMLSQVTIPLVVPACELNSCDVLFFKSWLAKANGGPYEFKLRDVARATSAAPTYFPMAQIQDAAGNQYRCVDGGLAVNNPTLAVMLEAVRQWPHDELAVLSLGTGDRYAPILVDNEGLSGWALQITTTFMDMSVGPVQELTELVANAAVTRCDIALTPGIDSDFTDASVANIAALQALAGQLVAQDLATAKQALV